LGRPQSAADNHCVTSSERGSKGEDDAFVVIADVLMKMRRDAIGGELLTDPLRVGIWNLTE